MTQPNCTKMAISQLLLRVASSNLVGRKSKWYFTMNVSLLLSVILCWREIRPNNTSKIQTYIFNVPSPYNRRTIVGMESVQYFALYM